MGALDLQAFFLVGAVIAFHKGIAVRPMRGAHLHLDTQALAEAQQSRGKIAALRSADQAGVAIQGERGGQPLLAEDLGQAFQRGLGREVGARQGCQQRRGASIDHIEHFEGSREKFWEWANPLSPKGFHPTVDEIVDLVAFLAAGTPGKREPAANACGGDPVVVSAANFAER